MKKTERQSGIVYLLKAREKMNAKDLAQYFEVSERTIYRDIDALSQLKVPIIAYEGLGGGYEIDPSYFMPSIKLSEQEILMLLMVLKAGEALRIPNLTSEYNLLSSKVINALEDETKQNINYILSCIEFDMIKIAPLLYLQDVLKPLLDAFGKSCDLQIGYYHPERDETVVRRFSPKKLSFEDGGWYVTGFCHLRQAKRTFRVDRIKSITCIDEENHYMNIPLELPENDNYKWFTYELLIDPALFRVAKEDVYLKDAQIKQVEGSLLLSVSTPYKNEICQFVLSHPRQVTALQPDLFVKEIEKISQALCKKYL